VHEVEWLAAKVAVADRNGRNRGNAVPVAFDAVLLERVGPVCGAVVVDEIGPVRREFFIADARGAKSGDDNLDANRQRIFGR
jgi:hypothetical protein